MIDRARIALTHERLTAQYGPRVWRGRRDPLDELVMTILSQNTSDRNSGRAFLALKQRYPTWHMVLDVSTAELYAVIKPAGLGNIKAPRIQQALQAIVERHGSLDLDFLDAMELEEARAWLLSLHGIGPKTAACVLLFALGKPALPVDTHVHRVSLRVGLIPPQTNAEKAHALLETGVAAQEVYAFHLNLIQHGRLICQARKPQCERCVLAEFCNYAHAQDEPL
jgi:endonuclease-3